MKKYPIGTFAYPKDNSYCNKCNQTKGFEILAGTTWDDPCLVEIVSDPYNREVEFLGEKRIKEFVTVIYKGVYYSVMNNFTFEFQSAEEYKALCDEFDKYYFL